MEDEASSVLLGSMGDEIQRLLPAGIDPRLCSLWSVHTGAAVSQNGVVLLMAGLLRQRGSMPRTNQAEYGYGYQWWTVNDGSYAARGILARGIFIDPKRGNWSSRQRATGRIARMLGNRRLLHGRDDVAANRDRLREILSSPFAFARKTARGQATPVAGRPPPGWLKRVRRSLQ